MDFVTGFHTRLTSLGGYFIALLLKVLCSSKTGALVKNISKCDRLDSL